MKTDKARFIVIILIEAAVLTFFTFLLPSFIRREGRLDREREEKEISLASHLHRSAVGRIVPAPAGTEMKGQVRIGLPGKETDVSIKRDDLKRSVTVYISETDAAFFEGNPPEGKMDHIRAVRFDYEAGRSAVTFFLDRVYETKTYRSKDAFYIDFIDPRTVYDRIILIDAGHGGRDPGARVKGTEEGDIALSITKEMKALFDRSKGARTGVYYTRLSDETVTDEERHLLIRSLSPDLVLSVHLSSTGTGRESDMRGVRTFYRSSDRTGRSKTFAEICQAQVTGALGAPSHGTAAGDEIPLVGDTDPPLAMVEVGYLTNPGEREALLGKDHQKKAAAALVRAVYSTLDRPDVLQFGGEDGE